MSKKVILIILDGWGNTQDPKVSAIYQANTPFFDGLIEKYPHANLRTDGLNVGLPEGQMGNSEVGHMNLGAGRIVFQDFVKKKSCLFSLNKIQRIFPAGTLLLPKGNNP